MISNFIKSNIKNEALSLKDVFGTDFVGVNADGRISITKDNALKNSDIVYACINYIASTICKMPIGLYRETDVGKVKVNNELSYLLKTRPNPYSSSIDFIQTMISNMLLYGNGFAKIITRKGKISELIILEPSNTRLEMISNKWVVITSIDNKPETLNYNQVIHLKDLSMNGVVGISRLEAIKSKLDNKANSDKMLSDYMCEGGGVKGVLTVPNKDEDSKQNIKDNFNRILRSKKDGVAVLNDEFKYTNIDTMSMADIEFVNNIKLTKEDIMSIFNINPALLGMSEKATNSNMQEMVHQFIQSLIPLVNKIEMEFNYKLLSSIDRLDHYFKFNLSSSLRGSDEQRANFYSKMIANGILSINEIRELEDRNKIEGGDEYYRSLNYVPLSIANEYQLSKAGSTAKLGEE